MTTYLAKVAGLNSRSDGLMFAGVIFSESGHE